VQRLQQVGWKRDFDLWGLAKVGNREISFAEHSCHPLRRSLQTTPSREIV